MDTFTPLDTLRALLSPLTSCFPGRRAPNDDPAEHAERDELEGLLGDSEDDRDARGREADALSLRSERGQAMRRNGGGKRKVKKGNGAGVELCGLSLFGRRRAGRASGRLDADTDTDADLDSDIDNDDLPSTSHQRQPSTTTLSAPSIGADEDAPALTPADIARLAETHFQPPTPVTGRPMTDWELERGLGLDGEHVQPGLEAGVEMGREAELEMAMDHALGRSAPVFEGFPGSGDGYALGAATDDVDEDGEPFGAFHSYPLHPPSHPHPHPQPQPQPQPQLPPRDDDPDDPDGDFGTLYARSSTRKARSRSGLSGSGSSSTPSLVSRSRAQAGAPAATPAPAPALGQSKPARSGASRSSKSSHHSVSSTSKARADLPKPNPKPRPAALRPSPPSSNSTAADSLGTSVRTPTSTSAGDVHVEDEEAFEGWIGSGAANDFAPVAGEGIASGGLPAREEERWPSTGLSRVGRAGGGFGAAKRW